MIKWTPPGSFCPKCGGPNPDGVKCGSCDYEPGDPLVNKNELFTEEQIKIRVAVLKFLDHPIKGRLKRFL